MSECLIERERMNVCPCGFSPLCNIQALVVSASTHRVLGVTCVCLCVCSRIIRPLNLFGWGYEITITEVGACVLPVLLF